MLRFLATRLLLLIPALFIVSFVVFMIIRLTGGDPVMMIVGVQATDEVRDRKRAELHLDEPLIVQYGIFLGNAAQGDFGRSFMQGKEVSELLGERLLNTLKLGLPALALSYMLAFPLGVLAAAKRGRWIDYAILWFSNLGIAIPGFVVSLIVIYWFGYKLKWFPTSGYGSWKHMVLPVAVITLEGLALTVRFVRSAMLEEMGSDYVRTARAKGLASDTVLWGHAFRNALLPTISLFALRLGWLLGGAVVVEVVFGWPGAGRLLVDSVTTRDYPLVQALSLVLAASVLLASLLADILYAAVNPRIRY
jgi:ABC-type dipeptide/oligopeptide/nickel transport system permease component